MIRQNEVFHIGRISGYRGISGEVEIRLVDDPLEEGDAEYLVFEMEGILVPFFWKEYWMKNDDVAVFRFEGIDSDQQAKRLVGTRVYYPYSAMPEPAEGEEMLRSLRALTGFSVYVDEKAIGTVTGVDDTSVNTLLYIDTPEGKELILPYHNDFLTDYSIRERRLCLALPEGLLDLNA